ncbi:MAG: CPBP family intramembrane glutamic endopeptidase [Leptospirales bacterium]
MDIITLPNSKVKLEERIQAGTITWKWPLILVFARLIFAVLAQALVAGIFMLQGHATPWEAAAPWWPVYGTLLDIGCLVLLVRLARKEGIRLFDLVSFQRQKLRRDLLLGVGFLVLLTILGVIGSIITGLLVYGSTPAPAIVVPLPLWGGLYSLLIWPIFWAIAEQMTYVGYALPRLEILSGKAWLAVIIVTFGWALQHSALPLMWDWHWAVYRFGATLLIGFAISIMYFRIRRLLPLIIVHWAANFVSVLTFVVLPVMKS